MKYIAMGSVLFISLYIGAVLGLRAVVMTMPRFVPAAEPVYQSDINYGGGDKIMPNYKLQDARSLQ